MTEHDEVTEGWHKSSRSAGKDCVEVRVGPDGVGVRNSRDRQGSVLTFTHAEWRAFLDGVRLDEFELPPVSCP